MWRLSCDEQGNQSDWCAGNLLLAGVGGTCEGIFMSEGDASCHNGQCVDCNVFPALCARQRRHVVLLRVPVSNVQNFDKVKSVVKIKGKEKKMVRQVKLG